MKRESWPVTDKHGPRTAGRRDLCFYCGRKIDEEHDDGCVMRERTVVIDCTFRIVRKVPESWDSGVIESHMNESSWCANNLLYELEELHNRVGCLCDVFKAEYVRDATKNDEEMCQLRITDPTDEEKNSTDEEHARDKDSLMEMIRNVISSGQANLAIDALAMAGLGEDA